MPPVFGPVSPSPIALVVLRGRQRRPRSRRRRARRPRPPAPRAAPRRGTAGRAPTPRAAPRRARPACGRRRRPCPRRARRPSRRTAAARPASVRAVGTPAASITSFANAFEPSICAAAALGPKTAMPRVAQLVGDAGDERRLGPDDDEVDVELARERARAHAASSARTGWQRASAAMPGVAGRGVQLVEPRRCGRAPTRARARGLPTRRRAPSRRRSYACVPAMERAALRGGRGRGRPAARRRGERDRVAVEEPLEIRIGGAPGRGDDAHARARRGARARLLPLRGAAPARRARCPTISPRTPSRSTRPASTRRGCSGASTPRRRAGSAARARSRRSRSRRRASSRELRVPLALVAALPDRLREAQAAFAVTGGLHATGLFAAGRRARSASREDVGRHNALDKVVGWAFGDGLLPLAEARPLRQRPALVRARPEGGGRRLPDPRRGRRAVEPRRRARRRPRHHALRLRPRRRAPTSTPSRGGSRPDGRPARRRREHALRLAEGARASSSGETLAERALAAARRGVRRADRGRQGADGLELPFPLLDDGDDGACGHRRASSPGCVPRRNEVCVVLPVDCPLVTAGRAARARGGVPRRRGRRRRGPLPGAVPPHARCRRSSAPASSSSARRARRARRRASSSLTQRCSLNVNTPDDASRSLTTAYDSFMGRYSRELAPLFADFAGVASRASASLDVGAGTGRADRASSSRARRASVAAIDPSAAFVAALPRALSRRRRRARRARSSFPWPDASFDVALAQLVVAFMQRRAARASRRWRVVGPARRRGLHVGLATGMEMLARRSTRRPRRRPGRERPSGADTGRRPAIEDALRRRRARSRARARRRARGYADFDDFWERARRTASARRARGSRRSTTSSAPRLRDGAARGSSASPQGPFALHGARLVAAARLRAREDGLALGAGADERRPRPRARARRTRRSRARPRAARRRTSTSSSGSSQPGSVSYTGPRGVEVALVRREVAASRCRRASGSARRPGARRSARGRRASSARARSMPFTRTA